jgi:hypothetical protein
MAITSYVEEEGHGQGKGHVSHGNGKGLGHQKHAQDAMEDGVYTINISGVNHVNHTAVDQTSPQTTLADGSKMNTEVRLGSITIDDVPGDGSANEALHLVTDNNSGRLRLNTQFDADQQVTLGDLDQLSFDYFIADSSRTDVIPVIRLAVDGDGNLATTADRGELVFEWAYQGFGATTEGSWQDANLVGDDWIAWQRANGQNLDQVANMTEFSDWADADGYTPVGGVHFDENSVVLGWSVALGSGNGTNDVYLDNLQVGGVTYDFLT